MDKKRSIQIGNVGTFWQWKILRKIWADPLSDADVIYGRFLTHFWTFVTGESFRESQSRRFLLQHVEIIVAALSEKFDLKSQLIWFTGLLADSTRVSSYTGCNRPLLRHLQAKRLHLEICVFCIWKRVQYQVENSNKLTLVFIFSPTYYYLWWRIRCFNSSWLDEKTKFWILVDSWLAPQDVFVIISLLIISNNE